LVHKLNERPFRKLAGSRSELYRSIDRIPSGKSILFVAFER
jgi:hypothetical protein